MVVNCAVYENGCRVGNIPVEDISEALKDPGLFVWVGLHEPDEALLRQIQEEFGLHDLAVEDALARPSAAEARGVRRLRSSSSCAPRSWRRRPHRVRRDAHLRRAALRRLGAPRRRRCRTPRCASAARATPHLLQQGARASSSTRSWTSSSTTTSRSSTQLEEQLDELEEEIFGGSPTATTIEDIYDLKRDLLVAASAPCRR